ncbi:penicillin-binding protein 2B [Secundilactobacillus pentosiphilus]|uniref:Penicillin-binding protein 2B n=1 Tax=Secundilactobacillus pentosiphilus TaxID=1714682 RepID=A0A1Z5IPC1_9LACO|nr:penicillin-binding transpeptidase domain-containing protein [Secundilactobacillus pentosiphilus]GAX03609.1 penicillin-binding protein 2B [Secundilactobacillus pentosiphilus]GAX05554.1 penicillin-binding protein 2B [Secundilactobacillus pentosiphilus]
MKQSPKRTVTSKQVRRNQRVFGRSLLVLFTFALVLFIGRFSYIAIGKNVQDVNLSSQAKKLYTANRTLKAQRGTIYDASNQPIAEDTSTYSLYAVLDKSQRTVAGKPMYVTNKIKTARVLSKYLPISQKRALAYLTPSNSKAFQVEFGAAGQNVSLTTKQKIDRAHLTGLTFVQRQARLYPNGVFASHLIGNVTSTAKGQLVGTMGIEGADNDLLKGNDGFKKVSQDNNGYQIPGANQEAKKPRNGDNVYTTLDSRLQTLLETQMTSLQNKTHAKTMNAVLMNAKTGAIVAATQRPTFNPQTGEGLNSVWRNTLIQDAYEPGSTMKVFTMAASIDSGHYNGNATYQSGRYEIGGRTVPDWNPGGWGTITYNKGFALSSNVAMAHLEQQMGAATWKKYIKRFKFLRPTNFGLPGEQGGSIAFNHTIEQANTAFGQGIQVTAIQMMQGLSAIGNNGKMLKPYLVRKVVDPNTGKVVKAYRPQVVGHPISAATAKSVRGHMEDVVYKKYGIGSDYKIKGIRIAAKTGTAQVSDGKSGYLNGDNSYLYSVAGMAPAKHPKYIMYMTMKQPTLPGTETPTQLMADVFKPVMKRALQEDTSSGADQASDKMLSYVNRSVSGSKSDLVSKGYKVTVIGDGNRVLKQSPISGQVLMSHQRVILMTSGTPKMPNLTGWSASDVLRLGKMLGLNVSTKGNGFVTKQSITVGKQVSQSDKLTVHLK